MTPHRDEPTSDAPLLGNESHVDGARTNGDHHSLRRIDSILQAEDTGIVDGHGNAVVLKGVCACVADRNASYTRVRPGWPGRPYEHGEIAGYNLLDEPTDPDHTI